MQFDITAIILAVVGSGAFSALVTGLLSRRQQISEIVRAEFADVIEQKDAMLQQRQEIIDKQNQIIERLTARNQQLEKELTDTNTAWRKRYEGCEDEQAKLRDKFRAYRTRTDAELDLFAEQIHRLSQQLDVIAQEHGSHIIEPLPDLKAVRDRVLAELGFDNED